VGSYDVAFRLQENRWNGTVAPQLVVKRVFDTPERYHVLRERFGAEWKAGEQGWSEEGRAIFAELELAEVEWRSLLESETFRALLAAEAEPLAEAA
jgi:hypothetical protein